MISSPLGTIKPVRFKRLSTGHVAMFNQDTQELVLVEPGGLTELSLSDEASAWPTAQRLVTENKAIKLTSKDLQGVQQATQAVVMLNGTGGWPP
jgi:hypothetical protein